MKIYTKTGDGGETSLFTGKRVSKAHVLIESFGMLDELNSSIGSLVSVVKSKSEYKEVNEVIPFLEDLQGQIFSVGSYLASECSEPKYIEKSKDWIQSQENYMDKLNESLPDLTNFILPGGSDPACKAHLSRVLARKAERHVVGFEGDLDTEEVICFLNRLSDFFFVLSRWFNFKLNCEEPIWKL